MIEFLRARLIQTSEETKSVMLLCEAVLIEVIFICIKLNFNILI